MKLDNHEGFNVSSQTRIDIDALVVSMRTNRSVILRAAINEYLKNHSDMVSNGRRMIALGEELSDGS